MTDTSRRRFLEAFGLTGFVGLAGCTSLLEQDDDPNGSTATNTETATATETETPTDTPTSTPEPDYPVTIDLSKAPSIEEAYNPKEMMPEGGQELLNETDLGIKNSMNRTEQLKQVLKKTTGRTTEWLTNARFGAATAWQTLDWANHDNMIIDIVTTGSGGIGPSIETTYKKQNRNTQTDLLPVRGLDTTQQFQDLYTENTPQSTWHNGNRGDNHRIDFEMMKEYGEDFTKGHYEDSEFDEINVIAGFTNNFIPGVNDRFTPRFEEYEGDIESLVIDDDYWRELSKLFESEQAQYMQQKQDLARAAAFTGEDNTLGVFINENEERVMEEMTQEQYKEVFPNSYHWDLTQVETSTPYS